MAGFDLYFLFVENVFGGWLLATVGFIALFVIFAMLSRMSTTLLITLLMLFTATSLILFTGGAGVFLIAIVAIYFFTSGIIKWINGMT